MGRNAGRVNSQTLNTLRNVVNISWNFLNISGYWIVTFFLNQSGGLSACCDGECDWYCPEYNKQYSTFLKLASIVILGYITENFQHWIVRLRARLNKGKTPEKVVNTTDNRIFIVPFGFLSISQTSKYLKIYIWVFALQAKIQWIQFVGEALFSVSYIAPLECTIRKRLHLVPGYGVRVGPLAGY